MDSLMDQMHGTYDFEPILIGLLAPELVKGLRVQFKAEPSVASDQDLLRMYSSGLTILYLSGLWRATLQLNGVNLESFTFPDSLPPDLKVAYQELDRMQSGTQTRAATAADVQELLEKMQKFRRAMVMQIRPDALTSEPYRKFVEQYRHDSKVTTEAESGKETVYEVWREGFWFTMVERAGALKILAVAPAWAD